MEGIYIKFGMAEPFHFTDAKTGEIYEVRMNGTANVSEYDISRYPCEEELTKALRSGLKEIVEGELAEAGRVELDILSSGAREKLGIYLTEGYEKVGIKAEFLINEVTLSEESMLRYQNSRGMGLLAMNMLGGGLGDTAPQPKLEDLAAENHGPVVKISSHSSSTGMSMGSQVTVDESVIWQEDGSVRIEKIDRRYGKEVREVNIGGQEAADKLREYVRESRVADMAQVPTIQIPSSLRMTDCSSSSHITFTFNDKEVNGNPAETRTLDRGSYWELQSVTLRKINELIQECVNTGKCLEHKESSYDPMKPGPMMGFMGMGVMSMFDAWKCNCGTNNTGKFCTNCGSPRSWKCKCGTDNTGKFCTNCGSPRSAANGG